MTSLHSAQFFCIPQADLPLYNNVDFRLVYSLVSFASGILGLGGALWQTFTWSRQMRLTETRRPSRAPKNPGILFCLALANTLFCIGVMSRAVAMLLTDPAVVYTPPVPYHISTTKLTAPILKESSHNLPYNHHTYVGQIIRDLECSLKAVPSQGATIFYWGSVIETFILFAFGATATWTCVYAVDALAQVRRTKLHMTVVQVICWSVPVATAVGGQLAITIEIHPQYRCADSERLTLRYLVTCFPIFVVLISNPILLWATARQAGRAMRGYSNVFSDSERKALSKLRKKFLLVIIFFSICWLPNLVDSIMQLVYDGQCLYQTRFMHFFPLWITEAFLNPLQGLFNCLVYRQQTILGTDGVLPCKRNASKSNIVNRRGTASETQTLL